MKAEQFVQILKQSGYQFFSGVPCSFFQSAINCVLDDKSLRYIIAPNEGAALSMAAGATLAGKKSCVMIQNSGLGNLINPLTSLSMIYGLPTLLFISGRSYGVPDEPQHEIIGKTMGALLDSLGIPHQDLPEETTALKEALAEADQFMKSKSIPYAFFVKKGTIATYDSPKPKNRYPLTRLEAISLIAKQLPAKAIVVATTGMPSRELFATQDRPGNFYMQGSMGHAMSIALGLALEKPKQDVVVLDGDGALIMHLGGLSSIGFYRPPNFRHIILDNESYETTGCQQTTSSKTDFCKVAIACGYIKAKEVHHAAGLKSGMKWLLKTKGPALLRVKINTVPAQDIPRISTKHSSIQIARNFAKIIASSE